MSLNKYIVANWKLNGGKALIEGYKKEVFPSLEALKIIVCPPYPFIEKAKNTLTTFSIGAQDVSAHPSGAFTGDVSASMLKESGCAYIIIGHSERREHHGETEALFSQKIDQALLHGLTPIYCIGESMEERSFYKRILKKQLSIVTPTMPLLIAYEPRWAIGSGVIPSLEDIASIAAYIRTLTPQTLLYGGSVDKNNAQPITRLPLIQGLLVGGASLKPDNFAAMCQAVGTTV
jgi:triosephosphate isomerase